MPGRSAKALLRYAAIRAGLEAFALPGIRSLLPAAGGRGMIFTLHHVQPGPATGAFNPNAHLSITPEFLEAAIEAALECGMVPAHLHELPALLAEPSDRRTFMAFTLDDGYRNNAAFAAPVFRKFGVPYTIFITPGFVERTRTMWWETAAALATSASAFRFDFGSGPEEVRSGSIGEKFAVFNRLAAFVQCVDEDEAVARIDKAARDYHVDSISIVDALVMNEGELRQLAKEPLVHLGAHTVTHVNLRRVGAERLRREIADSAAAVERYANRRPLSFSYPYGGRAAVGAREAQAAADAGFAAAVTTQPGVLGSASVKTPMALPRVSLNGLFQKKRYVKALISGLPLRFA